MAFRQLHARVPSQLSHVQLFATPWTAACKAPPSTGFCRQEYWSGLPFPSPGDLLSLRDQTHLSCVSCFGNGFFTTYPPAKPVKYILLNKASSSLGNTQWMNSLEDEAGSDSKEHLDPRLAEETPFLERRWATVTYDIRQLASGFQQHPTGNHRGLQEHWVKPLHWKLWSVATYLHT